MPSVAPILERSVAAGDDANILLVQRKMPWGEWTRRARDRAVAVKAALLGETQQITAGLEQRHEAELARRQAAADAIARAARENAAISAMQMQQLNNRSINCTYGGGYMSCN